LASMSRTTSAPWRRLQARRATPVFMPPKQRGGPSGSWLSSQASPTRMELAADVPSPTRMSWPQMFQQHDADWTAPLRELIASLRELETRFKHAGQTIRQNRPDEQIGNFPSLEGIETMASGDLGIRECFAKLAVQSVERRSDQLVAEAEEAERVGAETLRRQNQSHWKPRSRNSSAPSHIRAPRLRN
jgi:hypothetical protein